MLCCKLPDQTSEYQRDPGRPDRPRKVKGEEQATRKAGPCNEGGVKALIFRQSERRQVRDGIVDQDRESREPPGRLHVTDEGNSRNGQPHKDDCSAWFARRRQPAECGWKVASPAHCERYSRQTEDKIEIG